MVYPALDVSTIMGCSIALLGSAANVLIGSLAHLSTEQHMKFGQRLKMAWGSM